MLIEHLEDRQLLALSPVAINTGDIAPIALQQSTDSAQAEYRITHVSTLDAANNKTELERVPFGNDGSLQLKVGSVVAGYLFASTGLDENNSLLAKGQFLLLPGILPGIPNDLSSATGFQGKYEIEFSVTSGATTATGSVVINVGAGFSVTGDLKIENASARLDIARIQQRLNFLGFTGPNLQPLPVDGIAGSETVGAAKLFKAAVHATGEVDITEVPSEKLFDARMVRWLNSTNAPSWVKVDGLVNFNK